MKKLPVLLCIFLLSACAPSEVPSDKILERNGIKYEINSQIPFTGVSTDYYENGQLEYKKTFKNGVENGLSEDYSANGQLKQKVTYKDGELNGLSENYYENGPLRYKSILKDGVENGLTESYHENGQLRTESNWKDGERNGLYEGYYENGQEKEWSPLCYQNDKEVDISKCKSL